MATCGAHRIVEAERAWIWPELEIARCGIDFCDIFGDYP